MMQHGFTRSGDPRQVEFSASLPAGAPSPTMIVVNAER
jgi:hypothetical protein